MQPKLKVLLVGSGGRESAIAFHLRKSPLLSELKVFPGNGGFPDNEILPSDSLNILSKESVQSFLKLNPFDFIVVGPEDPLVAGFTDWATELKIPTFGPDSYCAQVEGSKNFAKSLMLEANVPTAEYKMFTEYSSSLNYLESKSIPIVIKADGLAAGKGVTVATTKEMAVAALKEIFEDKKFGESGNRVVIEEFMDGQEASIFAISDGDSYFLLPAAQDHKRAFDNDQGPNTGGMGAYCPAPVVTEIILQKVKEKIFDPMFETFRKKGHPYRGLLYAGLMISSDGEPKVVEFNCRFGDPETQCVLAMFDGDLLELLYAASTGKIKGVRTSVKSGAATVVVLAAQGYPDSYEKNIPLNLPETSGQNVHLFHAGTSKKDGKVFSSGGRILGVVTQGTDLKNSIDQAYSFLEKIQVPKTFYRKDIGHRAL
ncbi:phosphoribosylamine--glycine ligase [Leptospira santarosai]|uniref:phosphoribosylamine--glycine ligase n=1 Tax=Leptospira santarosai TaxID=28183 RepID=UPI0024AF354B|nr:phosphoribosylamine--glycine ligase [Leptospira santarosai]MDI7209721.1 phosphoribosylamine--glycine ligase [Leptospira santarosai]MDI7212660.1 phosphoribosylamine--glycine ligase [Leptospira santarosai]MDI7212683.1 phosphoribosylamine--glycine ligase [Leptospira santarosai]